MLNIIDLEQGTDDWLEYRNSRIGASSAPIIMGTSPYKTSDVLMQEMLGLVEKPPMNGAMAWGHSKEQEIRDYIQGELGELFIPKVVVHPDYPWMMASLDGLNFSHDAITELKTCNAKIFEQALNGICVPQYYDQIQHQLACCPGIDVCYYACLHKGAFASFQVERDEERIAQIIASEKIFYDQLQKGIVPEKTSVAPPDGYKRLIQDAPVQLAERLSSAMSSEKMHKEDVKFDRGIIDSCKEQLSEHTREENCLIGDLKLTYSLSKGAVDWKAVQEHYAISDEELDRFRKEPTMKLTVTQDKNVNKD